MKEKESVKLAIKSLKKGWGANCTTKDYCDFPNDLKLTSKTYPNWLDSRCQSCRCMEVIKFLEEHLSYLNES